MFAAFDKAAEMAGPSVQGHLVHLHAQLSAILADGLASGVWPGVTADSAEDVFTAISPFSHPALVQANGAADRSTQLARVIDLIDAGLRST